MNMTAPTTGQFFLALGGASSEGKYAEFALAGSALSDAQFDSILAYARARYALALL